MTMYQQTSIEPSPVDWPRTQASEQRYRLRPDGNRWTADPGEVAARDESREPLRDPRLLIDLPNWLGDLVMALPATDRLVRANPCGSTTLHVRPATARLAQVLFPRVRVIATPRQQSPLLTLRRLLRSAKRADIGVTLRNASRAKIVLWLTSRWRLGTSSQGGSVLLNWSHRVVGDRHQVHDADPLLGHLGLPGADPLWRARLPKNLRQAGVDALGLAGLDRGRSSIGLAPGVACGGSAKRWPEERFGRLAALLKGRGFSPVVVIGPGEGALAKTVVAASGTSIPVVGEDLDAAGLAGVLCCLDALVGNDSGPAHTAAVFGVPSLALFGPTDPRRTAPLGSTAAVVTLDLPCSPCLRSRCPLDHCNCLQRLSVENVESHLINLIEDRTGAVSRVVQA